MHPTLPSSQNPLLIHCNIESTSEPGGESQLEVCTGSFTDGFLLDQGKISGLKLEPVRHFEEYQQVKT